MNNKKKIQREMVKGWLQRFPVPPRRRLREKQPQLTVEELHDVAEWMGFQADCKDMSPAARCAHLARYSQSSVAKRAKEVLCAFEQRKQEQGGSSSSSSLPQHGGDPCEALFIEEHRLPQLVISAG